MEIQISKEDLEGMRNQNGLAFLDCSISPQELLELINRTFIYGGILLGNSEFKDILSFQHDGIVDLLLPFRQVELHPTKLVIWQAITYQDCHGVFLPEYIRHTLDGTDIVQERWTKPSPAPKKKKKGKGNYEQR